MDNQMNKTFVNSVNLSLIDRLSKSEIEKLVKLFKIDIPAKKGGSNGK